MENPSIIKCPWNLNSYYGRWMYFSWMSNPKLNFISNTKIEEAKILRLTYVCRKIPTNTITEAKMLYAQQVCENAFHPDTNEIQNIFGRLSFIPIGKGILITALLAQFSKYSSSYVLHGINQSYDSFVNFTNRNGDNKISQMKFRISLLTATIMSTLAAFHLEHFLTRKIRHPLLYRFIPITTLLMTSIINVPIMRHNEIIEGVKIYDCNKNTIGYSKFAAVKGIGETVISRIIMFAPTVVLIQYFGDVMENQNCWFRKQKWLHSPFKSIICGLILIGMLPTACAIFSQFSSVESSTLKRFDEEAYHHIMKNCSEIPDKVYYNKGL